MEQERCDNCLYYELDIDALPCADCCKQHTFSHYSYWAPEIDKITDPFKRLGELLKSQTYLLLEIGRLKEELNSLVETVKERNKE